MLNRKIFGKILLILAIFLSGAPWAMAQSESVQVKATALPSRVTLGDEIRFLIQVERPKKFTLVPPSNKIKIAPFEIKKIEVSPYVDGKNRVRETFVLTLTIFELGEFKIPPMPIEYKNEGGRVGRVMTEPVSIKVVSVGKKPTDKDDIRPIKGPVSFDLAALRTWLCGIFAVLLAVILAVKIILRRRKKGVIDPDSLKPPHERAILELERLWKKGFLEAEKNKEFYSELTDILRRYLERQFQVEALEQTSFEIVQTLKAKQFEGAVIVKAKNLLEQSDLVKFAKRVPPRRLADELARELAEIVESTKPKEGVAKKV